jgi:hypothetical protein
MQKHNYKNGQKMKKKYEEMHEFKEDTNYENNEIMKIMQI